MKEKITELSLLSKQELINKYLEQYDIVENLLSLQDKLRIVTINRDIYFDIIKTIINNQDNNEALVCQQCGSTHKVRLGYSPYCEEIYDKLVPVIWCEKCYKEDALDV